MNTRSIACEIQVGKPLPLQEYLTLLKNDWKERAEVDPTLYVAAASQAPEEWLLHTGRLDYDTYFVPQLKEYITNETIVLELGCGIGRMSYFIVQNCGYLIGIDITPNFIKIARQRLGDFTNCALIENSGASFSQVESGTVDIVFEYIVFQHIPSYEIIDSYMAEIERVLKSGGVALLQGRDIVGLGSDLEDNHSGNTWHGIQFGPKYIRNVINNTKLSIISETGMGTDMYWVLLQKEE